MYFQDKLNLNFQVFFSWWSNFTGVKFVILKIKYLYIFEKKKEMVKREVVFPGTVSDGTIYSAAWHSNLLLPKFRNNLPPRASNLKEEN